MVEGPDRRLTLMDRNAEAAVQFAMRHPAVCSVLIGTGKVSSLQRNLDAASLDLSEDALAFVST
ncbi:hypothetical protein Q5Y75_08845 [Ruegeria sp. 2205SS24-7]|uniref:hypothetical protein n=1 Tax=Ruegeria discodermiae TaxID=3064389 RepID=UPI0027411291|nr:hypothetical protein [Ruegeria sp. 2205SS24-7]MDP5217320.1 hypothetical protein [Ruegeria sp. 2205SS24-7]